MSDILQPGIHPDADQLSTFVQGAAGAHERAAMLAHLAECAQCRSVVFLMQEKEDTSAPVAQATKRWTMRWLIPVGLAGATLACGLAVLVYLRMHHRVEEIAVNHAPVQAPIAPGKESPPPAPAQNAPPRTEKHGLGQTHPKVAATGVGKSAGISAPAATPLAQAPAPMGSANAGVMGSVSGGVISSLAAGNAPASAPPASTASHAAKSVGGQRLPVSPGRGTANFARDQAPTTASLARAAALPALRIEHDRGPDDGTSQVSGLVTDQTGAAVSGATVTLRDQAGMTREITSSQDGSFHLTGVLPGQYELVVTASGFQAFRQSLDLKPRDMAMLDSKLTVGAESQTVTVTAEASTLNTDSNVVSSINSQSERPAESKNRNLASLSTLGLKFVMAPLPSHNPAAMTVTLGKRVLSLDSAGTLFASHNGGRKWKKVKPQWMGKVSRIESPDGGESMKDALDVDKSQSEFQLTTENGAVWVSADGTHWHAR